MGTEIVKSVESVLKFDKNGELTMSSIDVAKLFGKQHRDVMRNIRELIDFEPTLAERDFTLGSYVDENNQQRPFYDMTREGFDIAALGFKGKIALKYRVAIVRAFHNMEKFIREKHEVEYREHIAELVKDRNFYHLEYEQMNRDFSQYRRAAAQLVKPVKEFGTLANTGKMRTIYRRPTHAAPKVVKKLTANEMLGDLQRRLFYDEDLLNALGGN